MTAALLVKRIHAIEIKRLASRSRLFCPVENADALVDRWIPTYDRTGILHGHIRWHQALGALEHGDAPRALAIYADVL